MTTLPENIDGDGAEVGDPVVAVNVVVAVVLLSVVVRVPVAEPTVSVTVNAVLDDTVGVARLAPLPPLTLSKVLAVSEDHSVLVPVHVRLGAVNTLPLLGVQEIVAAFTATVALIESVVSEIVSVPVPEPVVMTSVCDVAELFVELTSDGKVHSKGVKALGYG